MLTNTFSPYVGGVARSVQRSVDEYRRRGHKVLVAAPSYKGLPEHEPGVIRFPAIQHFNGSEFSLPIWIPGRIGSALKRFKPQIVHAHHPFALGSTAYRVANTHRIPLVFTHHTMYEKYTHYLPGDSIKLKRSVVGQVSGYCNLCDTVIAPSKSVAGLLNARGVNTRITVIPTGVEDEFFVQGHAGSFRQRWNIPSAAFVVGHVGRMASEKNLEFLAGAVTRYLKQNPRAYFLLVGAGPMRELIRDRFRAAGVLDRLRAPGLLQREQLVDAYCAMNVFGFSSHTETQGMVLAEAMAAGIPVVAIDASGVREVVNDRINGRLLASDDVTEFAAALAWVADLDAATLNRVTHSARSTAEKTGISHTASKALRLYEQLLANFEYADTSNKRRLALACRSLETEWRIAGNFANAAGRLFSRGPEQEEIRVKMGIDPPSAEDYSPQT